MSKQRDPLQTLANNIRRLSGLSERLGYKLEGIVRNTEKLQAAGVEAQLEPEFEAAIAKLRVTLAEMKGTLT